MRTATRKKRPFAVQSFLKEKKITVVPSVTQMREGRLLNLLDVCATMNISRSMVFKLADQGIIKRSAIIRGRYTLQSVLDASRLAAGDPL